MAQGKKSFTAYCDWKHSVEDLTDEEAGKLFKHILRYVNDEDPQTDDRIVQVAFNPIKTTLKRDLKKWEAIRDRNIENGKKGGRPIENRVKFSLSGKNIPMHSNSNWVYLIQDTSNGDCKIGETKNLHNRRQTIKRSSFDLVYLDFFEVESKNIAMDIEQGFIKKFKNHRISGDWFLGDCLDDYLDYLKTQVVNQKAVRVSVRDSVSVSDIKKRETNFKNEILPFIANGVISGPDAKEFIDYWTEHGSRDKKMRFEKEKSFSIERRIGTWLKNKKTWEKEKSSAKKEKLTLTLNDLSYDD